MQKLLLCLSILCLSGCSVFMAAQGSKDVDLNTIQVGRSTQAEVENLLGKPIFSYHQNYGEEATYQYFTGDVPSYKRAAVYGVLDIATLFLAEIATSPIESLQGAKHTIVIRYTPARVVRTIRHTVMEAPLPDPNMVAQETAENIVEPIKRSIHGG